MNGIFLDLKPSIQPIVTEKPPEEVIKDSTNKKHVTFKMNSSEYEDHRDSL